MKVYTYDQETGYYDTEHNCQSNPLGGGWLYPPDYTEIAPELIEGKYPKWDGMKWVQVNDNRGEWYETKTGNKIILDEISNTTTGLTKTPPPDSTYKWGVSNWVVDEIKVQEKEQIEIKNNLSATDLKMPRALEDHVDLLIDKGLVSIKDYPEEFQTVYNLKKELRSQLV